MRVLAASAGMLLAGCAATSTIPLSSDTVQITAHAAPVCGMVKAQQIAMKQAASETINRGFDKFVILSGQYAPLTQVFGYTPVEAHSTGIADVNGGIITSSTNTTFSGGQPITGTSHLEGLVVKMFKDGDPSGANAISARRTLGPDWEKISREKTVTCLS